MTIDRRDLLEHGTSPNLSTESNRFAMKNYLPFIAMCVFAVFISGRPATDTFDKIQVREFSLVDGKGVQRVLIKVEDGGEVVFRMYDSNHTIRVKLDGEAEGSGLVLLDGDTNPGVHMLSKKDGGKLNLMDKSGKKREF